MPDRLLIDIDDSGVATVTLNRPEVHNAFDEVLIERFIGELEQLEKNRDVRMLVLTGAGSSFSAGADLNWMRSMAGYSENRNREDAMQLALLMRRLNEFSRPVVARVNGAAFGGGVGLIACCDIAAGVESARFALTEVRLGLVPAVIAPYVVAALGERMARRYFLSAERFDAVRAHELGLLHHVVADEAALDEAVTAFGRLLLAGGPEAHRACKALVRKIASGRAGTGLERDRFTAALIARLRVSDEGSEGIAAFLEKRRPKWHPERD